MLQTGADAKKPANKEAAVVLATELHNAGMYLDCRWLDREPNAAVPLGSETLCVRVAGYLRVGSRLPGSAINVLARTFWTASHEAAVFLPELHAACVNGFSFLRT